MTTEAETKKMKESQSQCCEVVLVGCGAPSRGMGWYHAEQLLADKCPSAKLAYIVEPWFLGPGALRLVLCAVCVQCCVQGRAKCNVQRGCDDATYSLCCSIFIIFAPPRRVEQNRVRLRLFLYFLIVSSQT